MPRAGQLRHLSQIRKTSGLTALDDLGQAATTNTIHAKVWASIVPLRGREFSEARQLHATVTHKIQFRAQDAIVNDVRPTEAMWLTHDDRGSTRTYNFLEVRMIDEREIMFECLAGERLSSSVAGASA